MADKLKVKSVTILDDTKVTPVKQLTDVLGISVGQLNVRVELTGLPTDSANVPAQINIEAMSWEPKQRRTGMSSMSNPLTRATLRRGKSLIYDVSVPLSDLARFLKAGDNLLEVATVRRDGGTSDGLLLGELTNWAQRGSAVQPTVSGGLTSGNVAAEQPDALTLFQAGGVEVLEVKVVAQPDLDVGGAAAKSWVFVRSPADVFFYTGHGWWYDGNLLLTRDARDHGAMEISGHHYRDWLSPEDLVTSWKKGPDIQRSPMDLDVLVINGCGVLFSDFGAAQSPASRWAQLLLSAQGPLFAILGYRATAPLDTGGGNEVAGQLGKAIAKLGNDWEKYPQAWLEINARQRKTWTAAALNRQGYWYINVENVKHSDGTPWKLGGFKQNQAEGSIVREVKSF